MHADADIVAIKTVRGPCNCPVEVQPTVDLKLEPFLTKRRPQASKLRCWGGRLDYDPTQVRRFSNKTRTLMNEYRLRASMKQSNKKPSKKKSQSYTTEDPTKWAVAVALPQEPTNSCNHFKLGDAVALTTCEFIGDGVVEYFTKYFAATFSQGRVHVCTFMHMMFFIDVQTGMLLKKSDRRKKEIRLASYSQNFFQQGWRTFVRAGELPQKCALDRSHCLPVAFPGHAEVSHVCNRNSQ